MATTKIPEKKTNIIKFGDWSIKLEKDQLNYYHLGDLQSVRDVSSTFTTSDLYELGLRISDRYSAGKVEFVNSII
jgi:hypothetical protein